MSPTIDSFPRGGRLSTLAAAWVIARRDFVAILFSRTFFFFLLGPLFPLLIGVLAGTVGARVAESADQPGVGIAMSARDAAAMTQARDRLAQRLDGDVPEFRVVAQIRPGERFDPVAAMASRKANIAAVLSGTPDAPVLTGPKGQIREWRGPVSMIAAQARAGKLDPWPTVQLKTTASSEARERKGRRVTAQAVQALLFMLTMMLAGMVLSNLVEEKSNKIMEVLAAAIPMDAVFFGKLLAMLGVSLVGISTWALAGGAFVLFGGLDLRILPAPAVGWPMLVALGVAYFAMAYLLLGSVFLAIGSLATTVREVQTLSMPVTMMQLMVFFLASFAMTQPGSTIEFVAMILPFSSPFAMLARATQDPALWPHAAALVWQVLCLLVLVRAGAALFRKRVMKSGSQGSSRPRRKLWKRAATNGGETASKGR